MPTALFLPLWELQFFVHFNRHGPYPAMIELGINWRKSLSSGARGSLIIMCQRAFRVSVGKSFITTTVGIYYIQNWLARGRCINQSLLYFDVHLFFYKNFYFCLTVSIFKHIWVVCLKKSMHFNKQKSRSMLYQSAYKTSLVIFKEKKNTKNSMSLN